MVRDWLINDNKLFIPVMVLNYYVTIHPEVVIIVTIISKQGIHQNITYLATMVSSC